MFTKCSYNLFIYNMMHEAQNLSSSSSTDKYHHHSRYHHFSNFILFVLSLHYFLQNGHTALHLASGYGKQETVRTLVELGVDKEVKDKVRNLMMMMMMMIIIMVMMMMMMMIMVMMMMMILMMMIMIMMMMITFSVATIMMIVVDDKGDSR